MTALATIGAEATRLAGRLPEPRRRHLQQALLELCERHWQRLRGEAPPAPLARAVWGIAPPAADLLADLAARQDPRLTSALAGHTEAQAFALLALWALEHGDAEGAHAAYVPMMLFGSPEAGRLYGERVGRLLRGALEAPALHPHAPIPPFTRALALIAVAAGRCDAAALRAILHLLTDPAVTDAEVVALRSRLAEMGVRLTCLSDGDIHFEQHGHPHKRITAHQFAEILSDLRRQWLGEGE